MTILIYFVFVFGIQTISAYDLKKIDIINGTVTILELDGDSNIYCVTDDSTFYKLNSNHELILSKNISNIFKILITPLNYAWIIAMDHIYLLKPNSTDVDHAASVALPYEYDCYKEEFFMDSKGNLIYNSGYEGVAMMRYDDMTPILIVNLENFFIRENSFVLDNNCIYLMAGTYYENQCSYRKFVIHSEDLEDLVPSARMYYPQPNLRKEPLRMTPSFLSKFGEDGLVVGYSGDHARLTTSGKNSLYGSKVLYSQPSFQYFNFHSANDNFYFFGKNTDGECFLNVGKNISVPRNASTPKRVSRPAFLLQRNPHTPTPYKIKKIKMSDASLCDKETRIIFDSNGNMVMASAEKLYRLPFGGDEIQNISPFDETASPAFSFEYSEYERVLRMNMIHSLAMDNDDNLWILGKGELYFLQKNSVTAKPETNSNFVSDRGVLKINKNGKEIFIGCDREVSLDDNHLSTESGLYVFNNNGV